MYRRLTAKAAPARIHSWTVAREVAIAVAAAAALAGGGGGCARSDLGSPCHLQDANGAEVKPQPGREYLYLGSSECESFTCLATPGSGGPYCSQACTGPGATCPSGLSCGQLTLNDAYLAVMKARLAPDRYQALFGQLTSSYYCVRSAK